MMLDQFLVVLLSRACEQGTWIYFHCPFGLQMSHLGHKSGPRCGPEPAAVPFLRLLCCISGKDMKTPKSSTQQPAVGMTTPTKATGGNQWPGRMTEVRANPVSLGMKATCWRRDEASFRVGSSPGLAHLQVVSLPTLLGCQCCSSHKALSPDCIWKMCAGTSFTQRNV